MNRQGLRAEREKANVTAFLDLIRLGESNLTDDAFRMVNGGGLFDAPPWVHPYEGLSTTQGGKAAGAPQFIPHTWGGLVKDFGFPDFSPENQLDAAVGLIYQHGALDDVNAGRIRQAIEKLNRVWVSLPGPGVRRTVEEAIKFYQSRGGSLEGEETNEPEEGTNMDPLTALSLIGSIGPAIINLIPQVKKLFDPAVPVAERNVGAAVAVLQTITDVAKTPDVHTAVAAMKSDPVLKQNVIDAVVTHPELVGLLEIGGGIVEARKANSQAAEIPLYRDRAFIIGLVFMVGVFMLLVDVFFVHPAQYDGNLRTQIVTGVLGFAAMVGAYFLGSSLGSQRKTDIIATSPAKE